MTWTDPSDSDLTGVTIVRRDDGRFPADPTDGTVVGEVKSGVETFSDTTVSFGTYHYTAFAHDIVPNYASGVRITVTLGNAAQMVITDHNAAGGNSHDVGNAVLLDSNGNIVVAGGSQNGADYDLALWRYTPTGVLDTTFGVGGIKVVGGGGVV